MSFAILFVTIFLFILFLIFLLIYNSTQKFRKNISEIKTTNEKLLKEEYDKIFHMFSNMTSSKKDINSIAISKKGFVFFKEPKENWIKVSINEILGYKIKKNEKTSGLSNAIVGGLIFGGVGAIVGAILGSKKETIYSMEILFIINNFDKPKICIEFLGKGYNFKSDSMQVKSALENMEEVLLLLKVLEENYSNNKVSVKNENL